MKSKKLLSTIILIVAILVISIFSVVYSIAQKPTVTKGEFPFSITYELNGETAKNHLLPDLLVLPFLQYI